MALIKAAGLIKAPSAEPKNKPKLKIMADETGALRVFLFAGNGAELFRSVPAHKRGNAERTLERIRAALPEAELEPGPRQALRR